MKKIQFLFTTILMLTSVSTLVSCVKPEKPLDVTVLPILNEKEFHFKIEDKKSYVLTPITPEIIIINYKSLIKNGWKIEFTQESYYRNVLDLMFVSEERFETPGHYNFYKRDTPESPEIKNPKIKDEIKKYKGIIPRKVELSKPNNNLISITFNSIIDNWEEAELWK